MIKMTPGTRPRVARVEGKDRIPSAMVSATMMMPHFLASTSVRCSLLIGVKYRHTTSLKSYI